MTNQAAPRRSPRVLDMTEKRGTFGTFTCRLSEGGVQSILYAGPGSPHDLRQHLQAPADPDLVVLTLHQGVGLDLLARPASSPSAQRELLADDWAALADSLDGNYWLPRDPERQPAIARVYFERDAMIQVELHEDTAGRQVIRCPTSVYIWIPSSATDETRTALPLRPARGVRGGLVSIRKMKSDLADRVTPRKNWRRGWDSDPRAAGGGYRFSGPAQ